jgi:hypothetical protein
MRNGATTLAVAMLSKPWKTAGSTQRTFIRCSLSFMKSLTSALLRRRRTTTKIGNIDLGPSWPEAWRRTKGQHSLPGAVLSLFPTGTMREMLAVNQLRKGGFNGTIRYLSERNQNRPFSGEKHCAGKSYPGTLSEGKGKAKKGD